ncbi:hypothetical protein NSPZN2_80009 [Nitrospira defluvii]|uniref:Uncharacterized protein n=1 Tax=Nitrospira defluvii TaxID=330214 RepID=A0ABM8SBK0_9BACT|nr:hypothetical protein NSPZN2_80009 [Nitrospira defluvii]
MPEDAGADSSEEGVNLKERRMRSEQEMPARQPATRTRPAIPTDLRSLKSSVIIVSL